MICTQCGCKTLTVNRFGMQYYCTDCFSEKEIRNPFEIQFKKSELPPAFDSINHPSHYTSGKIEVIDFIEDQKLNFHRGNAIKYLARAGKKNPEKELEDLKKAHWYLNREIDKFEKK